MFIYLGLESLKR